MELIVHPRRHKKTWPLNRAGNVVLFASIVAALVSLVSC